MVTDTSVAGENPLGVTGGCAERFSPAGLPAGGGLAQGIERKSFFCLRQKKIGVKARSPSPANR
jgi:hypothetical protein